MPITLQEVANAVGVTVATVSNAINSRGKMSAATRQRILDVAREMGYTPNTSARSLASSRSDLVGVVVPNIENPFYGRLARCITQACKARGYRTIIVDSSERVEAEREAVYRMVSERIAGLLISPINCGEPNADYIPLLERNKIKFCYVAATIPGTHYPFVMTDLLAGAFDLTAHLLDGGRRNIRLLAGPIFTARFEGYRRAHALRGVPLSPDSFIYCDRYDFDEGYAKTTELIASGVDVDAIITANDFMAIGALAALREAGVPVPGRVAVAGHDDMFFARVSLVPLTTVRQDVDAMSDLAVGALMEMVERGQSYDKAIYLPPKLIVRESTGAADR